MASVELRGITKQFGSKPAVDDVSIQIADGEFLSLLGPSGCGKSTILNIIAGLLPADSGTVLLDGVDISPLPPRNREVAMVFQDYALYPHMTVRQNLAFPLRAIQTPSAEIEAKVHGAAETLGIADLLDRLPRELSGGQRQRVALGRAIVRRPKVFLMDEPLSNLDAKLRVQMRAELKLLSKRLHTTTIYVTHDQAEAMTLSDRVVILNEGVLQQIGTPLSVYKHPANTFVAKFMGSMPMNLIEGVLERGPSGAIFRRPPIAITLGERGLSPTGPGESIILGIRPEDISVALGGAQREGDARMMVEISEDLGSDAYLHLSADGVVLVARVASGVDLAGQEVYVRINPQKAQLFDPNLGNMLVVNAED